MADNIPPLSGGQPQPMSGMATAPTPLSGGQPKKSNTTMIIIGIAIVLAIITVGVLVMLPAAPIAGPISGGATANGASKADVQALTYQEIIALGEPVECEITSIDGQEIAMGLKIMGENSKLTVLVPDLGETVTVVKAGNIYNELSGGIAARFADSGLNVDCDWLLLDDEAPAGTPNMPSQAAIDGLSTISSADLDCSVGDFGKEEFATAGTVCTMGDLETAMYGGSEVSDDVCSLLPEEQQEDCYAAA